MNETKTTKERKIETICKHDLHQIPVSSLYVSPVNIGFSMNGIEELSNSITVSGLLQPLAVAGPDEENRYEVLAGARRLTAILKARETYPDFMSDVPCNIVLAAGASETEKAIAVEEANLYNRNDIDSNFHRKKMITLFKKYETEIYDGQEGRAKDAKIRKNVIERAKDYFRVKDRYALMFYNIFGNDGNEDVEKLLQGTKISITQADKIVHMDDPIRKSVVDEINNGKKPTEALKPYIKKREPKKKPLQKEAENKNDNMEAMNDPKQDAYPSKLTVPDAKQMFNTVSKTLDMESDEDYFEKDSDLLPDEKTDDAFLEDVLSFLEDFLMKDYPEGENEQQLVSLCQEIVAKFM